jgi:hypothetical protein
MPIVTTKLWNCRRARFPDKPVVSTNSRHYLPRLLVWMTLWSAKIFSF